MTKHPLTDEMCDEIFKNNLLPEKADDKYYEWQNRALRGAYDLGREEGREDRLKQVIEWLEDYEQVCGGFIRIAYFKQAMRPQPQENNND